MWDKLKSSVTVWLGFLVEILGTTLDTINEGAQLLGLDGIKQTLADAGLDIKTASMILMALGPIIVLARLRSLLKK
jgi:hypothetical protein